MSARAVKLYWATIGNAKANIFRSGPVSWIEGNCRDAFNGRSLRLSALTTRWAHKCPYRECSLLSPKIAPCVLLHLKAHTEINPIISYAFTTKSTAVVLSPNNNTIRSLLKFPVRTLLLLFFFTNCFCAAKPHWMYLRSSLKSPTFAIPYHDDTSNVVLSSDRQNDSTKHSPHTYGNTRTI